MVGTRRIKNWSKVVRPSIKTDEDGNGHVQGINLGLLKDIVGDLENRIEQLDQTEENLIWLRWAIA
jgi:hypothetical protein